jgi:microcompartment protein CcmK/EutM
MRLGNVIGRVVLSKQDPAFRGARFLIVHPLSRAQFAGGPAIPLAKAESLVIYDNLGATPGHTVGFVQGSEAAVPFDHPTPVDAYNAAIIDSIFYAPPK